MKTATIPFQDCWVLHSRPYKENSLIVDLLSLEYGKVSLVSYGAYGKRSKKGAPRKADLLHPFSHLRINWSGLNKGVKVIKDVEVVSCLSLQGYYLYSGFYINELMLKLLCTEAPCPEIFMLYTQTLKQLNIKAPLEPTLRYFEKYLLICLGYGLPLDREANQGLAINPAHYYHYLQDTGFVSVPEQNNSQHPYFKGSTLLALHEDDYSKKYLPDFKRLMRFVISNLLGGKRLKAYQFFNFYSNCKNKSMENDV